MTPVDYIGKKLVASIEFESVLRIRTVDSGIDYEGQGVPHPIYTLEAFVHVQVVPLNSNSHKSPLSSQSRAYFS